MFKNNLAVLQNLCAIFIPASCRTILLQQTLPEGTFSKEMKNVIWLGFFFSFYLCLIVCPFYTTLFILCPFDIASCLLEFCEEAGWLHAVTGTSSQSLVYWWVTLLLCACKHIAQVPMLLPFKLLGSREEKCVRSINLKNSHSSKISRPMEEHNNQWQSGMSASESV